MSLLRSLVLLAATIATGLVAGTYAVYAHTIMPALKTTADQTFVTSFQALDRSILNPWFIGCGFIGALVLAIASVVASLGRPAFPWVVAALVLYAVGFVITIAVHVPLNDAIKAAGDAAHIADLAQVRSDFDEARWAAWNLVRTVSTLAAFGCLGWALVVWDRAVP